MRRITRPFLTSGVLVAATVSVALPSLGWAQDDAQNSTQDLPQEGPFQIETVDGSQAGQQGQTETQKRAQLGQPIIESEGPTTGQAGTVDNTMQGMTPTTPVSTAEAEVRQPMTLRNEVFSLRPNAGAIVYHDTTNATTTRAIYGLTADWNFAGAFTDNSSAFAGISSGGLFSHLGSATSDFWGSSPSSVVNSPGANLVIIPANLKIGYNISDAVRLSARGGGNVMYRSEGVSMNVGSSTATTGKIWRIYPNVGGDLDVGLTRGLTLGLRPDYTFTPGGNVFVGTLALGLSIG